MFASFSCLYCVIPRCLDICKCTFAPTKEKTSGKLSFKTPENNTVETRLLEDAHLRGKHVAGNVCLCMCNYV